jgi:hypothetical protein
MIPQPIILGAENRFIFADLAIPLDHQIVGIPLKETSSEFHRLYLARIAHKSLQICERCTLWQPRMLPLFWREQFETVCFNSFILWATSDLPIKTHWRDYHTPKLPTFSLRPIDIAKRGRVAIDQAFASYLGFSERVELPR